LKKTKIIVSLTRL